MPGIWPAQEIIADVFADFDRTKAAVSSGAPLYNGTPVYNGTPLYKRIFEILERAIHTGALPAGQRLPTYRELATFLGVDRSTVLRAYDELSASGLIYSHVGRGTFVGTGLLSGTGNLRETGLASTNGSSSGVLNQQRAGDIFDSRYSGYGKELTSLHELIEKQPNLFVGKDIISFAAGIPSRDSYPEGEFISILKDLVAVENGGALFDYSPSSGEPALRKLVIEHLGRRDMFVDDAELMILSGSQQGIDLMSSLFINPGDRVITEDPTYFWAISNFKARQAKIVGCPLDEEGINLVSLEKALRAGPVKFIYLMPANQNPTGITMSARRRLDVIELARRFRTPIFEDDFSGDLVYDGQPVETLRALNQELVIYQGTFSKALAPGVRLGWLVAPRAVIEKLNFAKRGSDLSTNSMAQGLLTEFLKRGLYEKHLAGINSLYGDRLKTMITSLEKAFDKEVSFTRPKGGLFLWLTLPEPLTSRAFLEYAMREGVTFSPGDICYVDKGGIQKDRTLRLSFIQNDKAKIMEGIERLERAYRLYLSDNIANLNSSSQPDGHLEHVLI